MSLNKNQKIIWTIYIVVLLSPLLLQPTSICFSFREGGFGGKVNFCDDIFQNVLFFGWIPALILHFLWRDKKGKTMEKS